MNNSFRVGDLVFLQHPTYYDQYDGCAALVVGGYAPRVAIDMRDMKRKLLWTYDVQVLKVHDCMDTEDGTVLVLPHQKDPCVAHDLVAATGGEEARNLADCASPGRRPRVQSRR